MPVNYNNSKHAILIMAHNQFEILEKLMMQLDHQISSVNVKGKCHLL